MSDTITCHDCGKKAPADRRERMGQGWGVRYGWGSGDQWFCPDDVEARRDERVGVR